MLIIAIPKSASTSLLVSLGVAQKIRWEQINHRWVLREPLELGLLLAYHTDMREYSKEHVKIFADPNKLYKQHIPPTSLNRALLRNVKKVILLRDPKEIIEAYWRANQVGMDHAKQKGFEHCKTREEWLNTAAGNGLWSDLQYFHDRWLKEAGPTSCIITYRNVVNRTKETINKIEAFWGLPITQENIVLAKRRYTRGPSDTQGISELTKGWGK